MGLFRHSRDRRRQSPFDKIATCCRVAVLGILPAMMAAAPPAAGQQLQIVGFNEAQARGALFEIVANPGNCSVTFHPDTSGIGSVMVQVDCTVSGIRRSVVTVRLFSRILLNAPWIVAQAIAGGADVQVVQPPALGGRDPTFVIDIGQRAGVSNSVRVILKATAIVAEPICPNPSSVFACSRNSDCATGFTCAVPCGACLVSTFTTPATPRTIRINDMRNLGFGVDPRTGNENAAFRVIWEASSRWNLTRRCPVSFDNGRTPGETVVPVLNCTARGSGARATFDMFNRITLNPPWIVETASVTPFQLGPGASVSNLTVPTSGASSMFTRIQLDAPRGREARAAVSIRIKAALPDPLPICTRIGPPGPPVCRENSECPQNPSGAVTVKCAVECGNRCVDR